jgi:hypothetical protein
MCRLFILAIVALLGFTPLGLRSVSAQYSEEELNWAGVEEPEPGADSASLDEFLASISPELRAYRVSFTEQYAKIPLIRDPEFMVVVVESGEFVLEVKGPGSFIVDPADDSFVKIAVRTEGENEPYYELTDQVILDEEGRKCRSLCTVLPGFAVQVTPQYRIIAPSGAICIWCLLNRHDEFSGQTTGELLVYPLLAEGAEDTDFSWIRERRMDLDSTGAQTATPAAMGWAFHPQARCQP